MANDDHDNHQAPEPTTPEQQEPSSPGSPTAPRVRGSSRPRASSLLANETIHKWQTRSYLEAGLFSRSAMYQGTEKLSPWILIGR